MDICVLEGELEKKKRDLALRQDFNICDLYKLFVNLNMGKRGVDCDDLYTAVNENLELPITKDEVFIIFYKVDKDGDSFWSCSELAEAFCPREYEYKKLVESRGGFYGSESSTKDYFEGKTRESLKNFVRAFCETEISVELIRQRIMNKLKIKPDLCFRTLDKDSKGYLVPEDFRDFLTGQNMYPIEKNFGLLFERVNKCESGTVEYEEFVTAITPFLQGLK
jgi:Ca2+-binding EF-hand superfamily protein